MKKLMIAAAIVCAAAMSQAATVSWSVSSVKTPSYGVDGVADGTFTGTGVGKNASFAVYLVSESVFGDTSLDKILDYSKTHTADFSGKTDMSNATLTSGDTYTTGNKVYALELLTYSDANGDWYVANKSWVQIAELDGVAQNATVTGLNTLVGGGTDAKTFDGSGATITGWQSVPEPTSGLLLLLGIAGLALRRRRA